MARGSNIERVNSLRRALAKAKKVKGDDPRLSNTELCAVLNIGKSAFTTLKNKIPNFPTAEDGPRGSQIFPAIEAIEALLAYETRADEEEEARRALAAGIVGSSRPTGRRKKSPEVWLPPSELMKYSRLQAETEERERTQGEYVPVQQVRDLAGRIYSRIKSPLQRLELKVDPNGLLTAEQRQQIGELGRTALLAIARDIEKDLGIDADDYAGRSDKPARKAAKTQGSRARRKRS